MLQKLLITTATSCVIISGASAQTAEPRTETAPTVKEQLRVQAVPEGALTSVSSDNFIKEQSADQLVFTKFKGTDVLGPDNTLIGNVDDLLFDKNGKIIGMVMGVGGFLGIGVKNVAIGMSAFDVIPADIGTHRTAQANDPTIVKLKVSWTKDQLMEAPDFQYFKPATRSATIPPPTTTGAAAPRPMAPAAPR